MCSACPLIIAAKETWDKPVLHVIMPAWKTGLNIGGTNSNMIDIKNMNVPYPAMVARDVK
jgi:hypothetical protein